MSTHSTTAIHADMDTEVAMTVNHFPESATRPEFVAITVQNARVSHTGFDEGRVALKVEASERAQGQMYLSLQQARDLAAAIDAALPCDYCEGQPVHGTIANGPNYTQDVELLCPQCGGVAA